MSYSSSFAGQIPLPSSTTTVTTTAQSLPPAPQQPVLVHPAVGSAVPAAAYDANTLAYYQAYYAQYGQYMASMGQAAGATTGWPVTGAYVPQSNWPPAAAHLAAAAAAAAASTATGHEQQADQDGGEDGADEESVSQKRNVLPVHGNEKTMNLNSLILTNIQQSNYFRNTLYSIRTFNELVDEIWESVKHCEPWERSSRKVGGQTGMCGSVRGVGAGGIISTAFCCMYKLLTLRPTRKQIMSMIKYKDAPYIRAIGLLYVRYTQPPDQLWTWFSKFLSDPEDFVPASVAGTCSDRRMTIGSMCRQLLTKQDWFSALFPRIPISIQKEIQQRLQEYDQEHGVPEDETRRPPDRQRQQDDRRYSEDRSPPHHPRVRSRDRDRHEDYEDRNGHRNGEHRDKRSSDRREYRQDEDEDHYRSSGRRDERKSKHRSRDRSRSPASSSSRHSHHHKHSSRSNHRY